MWWWWNYVWVWCVCESGVCGVCVGDEVIWDCVCGCVWCVVDVVGCDWCVCGEKGVCECCGWIVCEYFWWCEVIECVVCEDGCCEWWMCDYEGWCCVLGDESDGGVKEVWEGGVGEDWARGGGEWERGGVLWVWDDGEVVEEYCVWNCGGDEVVFGECGGRGDGGGEVCDCV